MDIKDFAVGAVVRLNSYSIKMTVDKIDEENEEGAVICVWFDDSRQLQGASFHPAQLIIVA